jgi:hypothetical protein
MKTIFLSLLMGFFCMVFAQQAQAGFEMSQSQEATIEGASSGKITQKQSQTMRVYQSRYRSSYNPGPARRYYQPSSQPVTMTYIGGDNAWVSWKFRDGKCKVYYSEINDPHYRYSTETNCNTGGMNIGGLRSGVGYKFLVEQH